MAGVATAVYARGSGIRVVCLVCRPLLLGLRRRGGRRLVGGSRGILRRASSVWVVW